jgi:hypothetical protein
MTKIMTFEKQILERIKQRQLRPTPKGFFYARDLVIWLLLGVFVAALSLGFAMTMFMIRGTDFGLFEKLGLSSGEKVVYSIPFFWIAASVAVAIAAFINFRNTRRGYRMGAKQFALVAVLISIALGSVIYALDIAKYVDRAASENFPLYNSIVPLNTNNWLDPEHGLLSGAVRDRESESDFMLRDANGDIWHVTGRNIEVPDDFVWASGDWIKLIGAQTGPGEFRAIEILPWEERPEKVKTADDIE